MPTSSNMIPSSIDIQLQQVRSVLFLNLTCVCIVSITLRYSLDTLECVHVEHKQYLYRPNIHAHAIVSTL
jgi:hypothetical protein